MTGSHGIGKALRHLLILLAALGFVSLSTLGRTPDQKTAYLGPGCYEIENVASGKALDLDARDQQTLQQWTPAHNTNQQWDIEDAGHGYVYIKAASNGMAVDIEGGYARDGARVILSQPRGADSQLWRIEEVGDRRVRFLSRLGKALDLPDGSHRNGAQFQVFAPHSHDAQRFRLTQISGPVLRSPAPRAWGNNATDEKSSYDLGYNLGIQDFKTHLRRTYARHKGDYSPQWEEAFIEGYYDGYDAGREAGRDDPGRIRPQEKDTYDDGYRLGVQDHRDHKSSNYMRYANRFDARSEAPFRKGYDDGYESIR